jgi:hypothetical protein
VIDTLVAAGPMGGDHGGRGGRGGRGPGLEVVASTLGMTAEEVREAISNGQTLAQLAEANGSSGEALIDAILAEMTTHLDEKVAAGDHTQEEADAKLAEATTRVTEFVNNTGEAGPMGGGPGGPRSPRRRRRRRCHRRRHHHHGHRRGLTDPSTSHNPYDRPERPPPRSGRSSAWATEPRTTSSTHQQGPQQ